MGPIWGRQDPGGPHVGSMNLDVWGDLEAWMIWQTFWRLHFPSWCHNMETLSLLIALYEYCRPLRFSLLLVSTSCWISNGVGNNLRCQDAHVMSLCSCQVCHVILLSFASSITSSLLIYHFQLVYSFSSKLPWIQLSLALLKCVNIKTLSSPLSFQACVCICLVFPGYPGSHQGTESKCKLWRSLQNCGLHVG